MTGATGFVGSAVCAALRYRGDSVVRLTRSPSAPDDRAWDPEAQALDSGAVEGVDAVVHLAGESIAAGRWTKARRDRIRSSRVGGTRLLVGALKRLERPPRVFVSASAIGYYGDRGDEILTEKSGPGRGFLADLCREWEDAAAVASGIRTAVMRFGVVLARQGGALPRMLWPLRTGFGGRIGSGRQYMSWISREDAVAAVLHAVDADSMSGVVNVVAPHPVPNREFTEIAARVLNRPAWVPVPAFLLKLVLGSMAGEVLLASTRVRPARLEAEGFSFADPGIGTVLAREGARGPRA